MEDRLIVVHDLPDFAAGRTMAGRLDGVMSFFEHARDEKRTCLSSRSRRYYRWL
jgi:hypothetical protein